MEDVEAGFAKLEGKNFVYYMQNYSVILGRNSKKSEADIDLSELGGGMNISRQHAKIFYDFERKTFALEVMGRNGCNVRGVHYNPGDHPVKLSSQDLIEIGDLQFYFLLPPTITSDGAKQNLPLLPGLPKKRCGRKKDDYYGVDYNRQRQPVSMKRLRFYDNLSSAVPESPSPYSLSRQGLPNRFSLFSNQGFPSLSSWFCFL